MNKSLDDDALKSFSKECLLSENALMLLMSE
jgi:hypothetical protein